MNRNRYIHLICITFLVALIGNSHAADTAIGPKVLDFTAPISSVTYYADKTVINVQTDGAIGEMGVVAAIVLAAITRRVIVSLLAAGHPS